MGRPGATRRVGVGATAPRTHLRDTPHPPHPTPSAPSYRGGGRRLPPRPGLRHGGGVPCRLAPSPPGTAAGCAAGGGEELTQSPQGLSQCGRSLPFLLGPGRDRGLGPGRGGGRGGSGRQTAAVTQARGWRRAGTGREAMGPGARRRSPETRVALLRS